MTIRQIKQDDSQKYLTMMLQLDSETKMMMLEHGERKDSPDQVRDLIEERIHNRDFLFVAEEKDEIVGMIEAVKGSFQRIKHSAYVVTGILDAYSGLGIGTKFFEELDHWANLNDITRLELTVVKQNKAAVHLYKKSGFLIEGTKKNSMKIDGNYVDEYYMAKLF